MDKLRRMKGQDNMSYEELRRALIKHPKVVDSLTPLHQMIVKETVLKDLGRKEGVG